MPVSTETARELLAEAGIDVETRLEQGDITENILSVAEEISADSVVMSGRKKSATGKVLFGSVTQSVLLSADWPVTVLMSED